MKVLIGVGNEMNGDDGIGVYIAKNFRHKDWIAIDCETVPENYIGEIKKYRPEEIIIVDASDMRLEPGAIRRIRKEKIGKASFSTHSIPLSLFISHVEELFHSKVHLIGIQPKSMYGEISEEVREAGKKLIDYIKNGRIEEIEELK